MFSTRFHTFFELVFCRTSLLCDVRLLAAWLVAPVIMAHSVPLTHGASGHQIHNRQCFSPDGRFIYYDSRNDETRLADSRAIGRVPLDGGPVEIIHRTADSCAGAVTCRPGDGSPVFIHGLPGLPYATTVRGAATLSAEGNLLRLDARDVSPPFTPGSSRGGTHAFHWSPSGKLLSCTYNDALVPSQAPPRDLRTIGILLPGRPVQVTAAAAPNEFSGSATFALVVQVHPEPRPGSEELLRAFDEDWLDDRTLVFQGTLLDEEGRLLTEVFSASLPDVLNLDPLPLRVSATGMPGLLEGVRIHRLTHTRHRRYPGVQGPRHWVRSSPDGKHAAFLAKDDNGVVQIYQVSRAGGDIKQVSHLPDPVQDVFDWSPCGRQLACIAGGRIHLIEAASGKASALTSPAADDDRPRYAVVFAPDGRRLATNRPTLHSDGNSYLQIHRIDVPKPSQASR